MNSNTSLLQCLGHLPFGVIQNAARLGILPNRLAHVKDHPKCPSCLTNFYINDNTCKATNITTTYIRVQLLRHIDRLGNSHSRPLWTALTTSVHSLYIIKQTLGESRKII